MIISVTQFNDFIKGVLDSESILNDIMVKGEVTNLRQGYDCYYFTLKDESSQLECYFHLGVKSNNRCVLENGIEITVRGSPSYYVPYGKLSFRVVSVQTTTDKGSQYLRFLELKDKLQKDGCFDIDKKRPIPHDCATIGIVTSQKGAVIVDIEQIALRRNPNVQLLLYPVKVQGDGSAEEIADGINFFAEADVDAVIVARGGGSNEDLMPFNSEVVVRAICACKIPTVSAVGHGIDYTLCDYACDARTATPSEAAEVLTTDCTKYHQTILRLQDRIDLATKSKLSHCDNRVNLLCAKLYNQCLQRLTQTQLRIEKLNSRLIARNPRVLFEKGFAVVSSDGKRVGLAHNIDIGQVLELHFLDGKATVTVNDVAVLAGEDTKNRSQK